MFEDIVYSLNSIAQFYAAMLAKKYIRFTACMQRKINN